MEENNKDKEVQKEEDTVGEQLDPTPTPSAEDTEGNREHCLEPHGFNRGVG